MPAVKEQVVKGNLSFRIYLVSENTCMFCIFLFRLRSKSVINDDITNRQGAKVSVEKNYPLRRQSAVTDFKFKPKVIIAF